MLLPFICVWVEEANMHQVHSQTRVFAQNNTSTNLMRDYMFKHAPPCAHTLLIDWLDHSQRSTKSTCVRQRLPLYHLCLLFVCLLCCVVFQQGLRRLWTEDEGRLRRPPLVCVCVCAMRGVPTSAPSDFGPSLCWCVLLSCRWLVVAS